MDREFEYLLGDVVQLRSGGPAMTVDHVFTIMPDIGKVLCFWMADDGKMQRDILDILMLRPVALEP